MSQRNTDWDHPGPSVSYERLARCVDGNYGVYHSAGGGWWVVVVGPGKMLIKT